MLCISGFQSRFRIMQQTQIHAIGELFTVTRRWDKVCYHRLPCLIALLLSLSFITICIEAQALINKKALQKFSVTASGVHFHLQASVTLNFLILITINTPTSNHFPEFYHKFIDKLDILKIHHKRPHMRHRRIFQWSLMLYFMNV